MNKIYPGKIFIYQSGNRSRQNEKYANLVLAFFGLSSIFSVLAFFIALLALIK